jgi:hypothetical protein
MTVRHLCGDPIRQIPEDRWPSEGLGIDHEAIVRLQKR